MNLSYSKLKFPVFAYISLPVFLFLAFYLRLSVGIPCIIAYAVALFFSLKKEKNDKDLEKQIFVSTKTLVFLFAVVLLWTFLGGLNGHWFQTSDWDCRNAIFRDLITHYWPVRYWQSNSALAYYIGHWLPAAAIARLIFRFGGESIAWAVGQNLLWIWTAVGLYLILLLLMAYHQIKNNKQIFLVLLTFVFFSGMDIIGVCLTDNVSYLLGPDVLHLEWWSDIYQYSSITTCVYWVFNQSIIPWLTVMCFLFEKTPKNYIFICVACLACGPLPLVGLAILMLARGIEYIVKEIRNCEFGKAVRNILFPSNLLCMVTVVPVYLSFYLCNNATSGTLNGGAEEPILTATVETVSIANRVWGWASNNLLKFLAFFLLEVGIYLILIFKENKNNLLYYTVWLSLLLIPHFHVGISNDFCMRASIPSVFLVMVFCEKMLLKNMEDVRLHKKSRGNIRALLLSVALAIGAVTPCVEIGRGIYHVVEAGTVNLANDTIYTFDDDSVTYNFSTEDPDSKLFFRYFAQR